MLTREKPRVSLRGLYPIGEAADALGISRTTLRRYTDLGYIKCSHRKYSLRKIYSGEEIISFWEKVI